MINKIKFNYLIDIIYYTIIFTIVPILTQIIIIQFPNWLKLTGVYYLLLFGLLWVIVSILFGMLFKIEYKKQLFIKRNKNKIDISKHLLYSFILLALASFIINIVVRINMYIVPQDVSVIRNTIISIPSPNDFNSTFAKMLYEFGFIIAVFLYATGEELFIRYIAYHKVAEQNSGKDLKIKFIISTSLAFSLYHLAIRSSFGYPIISFSSSLFISIAFCLIYIRTMNFIYPVVMHAIWNITTGSNFLLLILPSVSKKIIGEEINLITRTSSMFFNFVIFVIIILAYRFIKSNIIKLAKKNS